MTVLEDAERNRKDNLYTCPFRLVHDAAQIRARITCLLQDLELITLRRDYQNFLTDLQRTWYRELRKDDVARQFYDRIKGQFGRGPEICPSEGTNSMVRF